MFIVLAVNINFVTSSAQTVVPGLVVIVGFLGSSTFILTTLEGKPAPAAGQDTVFKVSKSKSTYLCVFCNIKWRI